MQQAMKCTVHAALRYLERVLGVDAGNLGRVPGSVVEAVRRHIEEILDTPLVRRAMDFAGDANCKLKADGIIYCIQSRRIITCYLQ